MLIRVGDDVCYTSTFSVTLGQSVNIMGYTLCRMFGTPVTKRSTWWHAYLAPGLFIKIPTYQYSDYHYTDERVSWPSYLYNSYPITLNNGIILTSWWSVRSVSSQSERRSPLRNRVGTIWTLKISVSAMLVGYLWNRWKYLYKRWKF